MSTDRVLTLVGHAFLAAVVVLVAGAHALVYVPRAEPGHVRFGAPVDVSGTVATYATDALVVTTLSGERRVVRVAPATTVVEVDTPTTVASLRPGRSVAIQAARHLFDGSVIARGIVVWGG